jgi:hypothetical protein
MTLVNNVKYYLNNSFYTVGDNVSFTATGISSDTYSGEIVIEDRIGGIPVLEIGQYAFYSCKSITRVIIKANLRSINRAAFYKCTSLEYIYIPSSVTFMGIQAMNLGTGSQTVNLAMTVEFGSGRSEKLFLPEQAICRRNNIFIIYPSNLPPLYSDEPFYGAGTVVICAPSSFTFVIKTTTTDQSKCPSPSHFIYVEVEVIKIVTKCRYFNPIPHFIALLMHK